MFRHPNIFASSAAQNAGINGWDALRSQKGRTTLADELGTVPVTLPALMRARSCKRADARGARQVLRRKQLQQTRERRGRLEPGTDAQAAEEHFVCCGQCRKLQLNCWDADAERLHPQALLLRRLLARRTKNGTRVGDLLR